MSKRKREIRKRQKMAEGYPEESGQPAAGKERDVQADRAGQGGQPAQDPSATAPTVDDSQIISDPRPAPARKKSSGKREVPASAAVPAPDSWLGQNKENLLLGVLVLYVIVLGLGTVGELFEIEWILNLPLFR